MATPHEPDKGSPPKKQLAEGEGAVNCDEVRKALGELEALYVRKKDAAGQYKDAIDAVAAKSGASKKALRAWIAARCDDKRRETHIVANQLQLLLETIEPLN